MVWGFSVEAAVLYHLWKQIFRFSVLKKKRSPGRMKCTCLLVPQLPFLYLNPQTTLLTSHSIACQSFEKGDLNS